MRKNPKNSPDRPAAGLAPTSAPAPAATVPARLARCLALMLDEVDYGMLLLGAGNVVLLCNQVAQAELDQDHPLRVDAGVLRARHRDDAPLLAEAIDAAARDGGHRLLILGAGAARASIAVRPLGPDVLDGAPATALLLGRRQVVENLSMQWFARERQLTPAETRVLEGLCAGVAPAQIAARLGVRISTVRTQIGGIREKTGARSIRELVRLVAVLPPMVPSSRDSNALLPPQVIGS